MEWDNLPSGWTVAHLGDVAPVSGENVEPSDEPDRDFHYVGLENIESNTGRLVNFAPTKGAKIKSTKRRFTQQHVLYGKLRPYLNKVWLPTFEGICATDLLPLLPDQTVLDRRYLAAFLRSPFFVEYSKRHMTGTKMPRLRMPEFTKVQIPLPPLDEQRRIVARIEELTERIDAARRLRTGAAEEAAAILPSALAEVFEEAEARGWEMETLGGLSTHVRYGLTAKASPHVEGTLFIRITDIDEDGKLRLDEPHYVQINDNICDRFRVQQDDILIARSGATAGKAHLCSPEGRAVFASYLIRFRLDKAKVFPRFLFYFLHSPAYWAQLNQWKIGGAQPNVNATNLKRIEVPLPLIAEQRRIVEYLDAVRAKVEAIRRYQEETQQEIEALTGAVLERAFRGEL